MRKAAMFTMMIGLIMIVLAGCSGGKDNSKLIIGIDDKFAPMGFRDENNELTGFDIDYAKAAGEQMGKQVEFQPIDWSAKESELNSGRIDLIWNGYTITDERKEKVLFTKPYLKNSQVIVVPATSSLSKLADLVGKTVGLQTLSSAADALDANPIKSKLKSVSEYPDNVLALTDLKTGRLDAVVIDEVVAKYYMSKEQGTYKLLDESLAPEEYGIGVKKGNEELLTQLQSALDELHKNGKAAEISKKWFGEDKVLN
ncbi:amino acid ABC transporter substrate-binding protein [Paenibacillus sp. Mc5Re-14]|uniref:amino acid ABC transporter substrate-binding protein n=1 Tax=Paenibacillus sp. Mc5Re-14 TaxID=1030529 RepID=UPI000A46D34A|nr:amino acid ABC transporter substrate-binding protein [Paenibacillus sp. Mc5Re-14]